MATINQRDAQNKTALSYLWEPWQPDTLSPAHSGDPGASRTTIASHLLGLGRSNGGAAPMRLKVDPTKQLAMAKLLVRCPQCDVNAPDAIGKRPLHLAVANGQAPLIRVLAGAAGGIDPSLTDADGVAPLQYAVQKGDMAVIQVRRSLPLPFEGIIAFNGSKA
jgi:ankyrin repeat protein